jgi:flavin reductase (NADH)
VKTYRVEPDAAPGTVIDEPYRTFMSGWPSGVSVITATDAAGTPRGLTCTSLTSVTLRPPTLLVCVNRYSGTLTAIKQRGMFGVNLLHAGAQKAAMVFASPDADRFAQVRWRPSATHSLPLLVDDASAMAQCALAAAYTVGTHEVLFGEVHGIVVLHRRAPLLYGLRRYWDWNPDLSGEDTRGGTE